ncbi:adenylate kinase [candidate division WOR-3 bacterium]|nr:adenylate kinase [candidate division WOR-3 bacterium]
MKKVSNLVLIGPPGSGKGTQAELLREKNGFVHYSTGDVFRDHMRRKTDIGTTVERYVTSGKLVPDQVALLVVNAFLAENSGKPMLFDGFPRTVAQAQGLDSLLSKHNCEVGAAVLIDLSDDEVVKRLTARRQCRKCSRIYNLSFRPPKTTGVCDECGGELYQREDDAESVIRDRLNTYHLQTEPVLYYYSTQSKLKRIDGALGRDRVYAELTRILGAAKA